MVEMWRLEDWVVGGWGPGWGARGAFRGAFGIVINYVEVFCVYINLNFTLKG